MFKHINYYKTYGRIMQFNKNKKEPIHRWYPFVEGYSREFIQSIVSTFVTEVNTFYYFSSKSCLCVVKVKYTTEL